MTITGKRKKRGRPAGAATRYPGIMGFAAHYSYSHQHVRLVLDGRRHSRRLMALWSEYQRKGGVS